MRSRRDTPRTPGCDSRFLCCTILTLLTACQPSGPDAPFETYLGTLGTALSIAVPATRFSILPLPPLPRKLQLDTPSGSLDQLDFLILSGCAVQATLLKRNSSLGRLAKPSQRLLLELEYLHLAPACITHLRRSNNDTLADVLQDAWRLRREQLPALIFNATLGSDEYRAFWLPAPAPGQYPRVSRRATAAALAAINHHTRRWLGGDYQAHNRDLEILLSEVAGGDGGALLQALSHQSDWLATANFMLEQRWTPDPLSCAGERDNAATMLPAVIDHYTNSEIPARAARMDLRYHRLLPPINDLEAQLAAVLPQPYRHWMDDRNQRFVALGGAPHRHLEQLDQFRQACATQCAPPCPKTRKLATLKGSTAPRGPTAEGYSYDQSNPGSPARHNPAVHRHCPDGLCQRSTQTNRGLQVGL